MSAKVKALSDWIVTSGNAEEVVRHRVPADHEIQFVPDQHLGRYLSEVTGRQMILWNGSCMVHEIFSVHDLVRMKGKYPNAEVVWAQDEPANQGPWPFIGLNLPDALDRRVRLVSRPASASTAAGSMKRHAAGISFGSGRGVIFSVRPLRAATCARTHA
mgnify:CR=1 FL=1